MCENVKNQNIKQAFIVKLPVLDKNAVLSMKLSDTQMFYFTSKLILYDWVHVCFGLFASIYDLSLLLSLFSFPSHSNQSWQITAGSFSRSLPVKKQFFLPTIPKCLIIESRQIVGILSLPYFTILRALRCLML